MSTTVTPWNLVPPGRTVSINGKEWVFVERNAKTCAVLLRNPATGKEAGWKVPPGEAVQLVNTTVETWQNGLTENARADLAVGIVAVRLGGRVIATRDDEERAPWMCAPDALSSPAKVRAHMAMFHEGFPDPDADPSSCLAVHADSVTAVKHVHPAP